MAPLFLGSIYTRLDKCLVIIVLAVGRYDIVMQADSNFPQVFKLKSFPAIALKPMKFLPLVTKAVTLVDDSKKMKSSGPHKPLAWTWLNVKPLANKSLVKVLDEKKNLCVRPSLTYLEGCLTLNRLGKTTRNSAAPRRQVHGTSLCLTS